MRSTVRERHSRRVRVLKFAAAAAAALIAVAFLGLFLSRGTRLGHRSRPTAPPISDGKLVMANPKLNGFTKEKHPIR